MPQEEREETKTIIYALHIQFTSVCCIFTEQLNSQIAVESQLGYELYSSALADILSSPSLSTPMTVGLYAKWGSGKSFMLNKLKGKLI